MYAGPGGLDWQPGALADSADGTPSARLTASTDSGLPPPAGTARIMVGTEERRVPWSDVARVDAPAPRGAKILFALLGLVLDAWLIASLSVGLS